MIRESTINLIGGILPAGVSLVCIPLILQKHGDVFFGIYSLQTALLMVVGLMDLGLSRGILLVTYDRALNPNGMPDVPFKAGMRLTYMVAFSVLCLSLGILLAVEYFRPATSDVKISTALHVISGALTVLTLPYRALLEIKSKFGVLNIIRSLLACSIPMAPLLPGIGIENVLTVSAVYVLFIRIIGLFAYKTYSRVQSMNLDRLAKPERAWQKAFVRRCGWVGLTNIGSLILTYADRILLGSMASASALASFVVAHELATKIWMVTGAVLSATMPRVAAEMLKKQQNDLLDTPKSLTQVRLLIIFVIIFPSMILAALLKSILIIWLGKGYGLEIEIAGKILIAGIALNSMSQLNFGLLQFHKGESQGAQLQLFNIILAAFLMALLIPTYGAVGAAVAFSLRLVIDSFATRFLLGYKTNSKEGFSCRDMTIVIIVFLIILIK